MNAVKALAILMILGLVANASAMKLKNKSTVASKLSEKEKWTYWAPTCPTVYIGDGECDGGCNTAEFDFDGGDCATSLLQVDSKLNEQWFICFLPWIGDGECDSACNSETYNFDGGDC